MKIAPVWWPAAWAGFIAVLMVIPLPPPPPVTGFNLADKVVHFVLFGIQASLLLRYLHGRSDPEGSLPAAAGWAILATSAFGAALEGLQALLPFRSAEALDLAADAVGAFLGATAYLGWQKFRGHKNIM
jgi:VanZ family protein